MKRKELALLCVSVFIALLVVEVAVRIVLALPDRAVAMTSLPSLVGDRGEVVLYEPDVSIREVALDGAGVVYDSAFVTNNLGLIDSVNYEPSAVRDSIVLLGDSFTAGYHGGRPWIAEFREQLGPGVDAYNLGVAGTGLIEFDKRLSWFTASFPTDTVLVLVISSDFYRPEWYPLTRERKLWLCPTATDPDQCQASHTPAFHGLDSSWDAAELARRAADILEAGRPVSRPGLKSVRFVIDTVRSLRETPDMRLTYPQVRANLDALQRLVARSGPERTVVLHLPEKHEVAAGGYDIDLSAFAEKHALQYVQLQQLCPFDAGLYLERDPHPNAAGYSHLARCVARISSAAMRGETELDILR